MTEPSLPFLAPAVLRRQKAGKRELLASSRKDAAKTIGAIVAEIDITGITSGQFSLIDIIDHVLDEIGPSRLSITSWRVGSAQAFRMRHSLQSGRVTGFRWMIDPGAIAMGENTVEYLFDNFGPDCLRLVNTHAKFATIRNDRLSVSLRSSMNLNWNGRLEQFDLTEGREMADFFDGIFDAFWRGCPYSMQADQSRRQYTKIFAQHTGEELPHDTAWTRGLKANW